MQVKSRLQGSWKRLAQPRRTDPKSVFRLSPSPTPWWGIAPCFRWSCFRPSKTGARWRRCQVGAPHRASQVPTRCFGDTSAIERSRLARRERERAFEQGFSNRSTRDGERK